MPTQSKINSLCLLIFLLALSGPLSAGDLPDSLREWGAGVSINNQATSASFAGGVTANNGNSLAKIFDASQKIDVLAYIKPAPEHVGKMGSLYMVARYNDGWFMKANNGQWLLWDFQLTTLVPNSESHTLQLLESLEIASQLSNLVGKFDVYVGYKVDNDIYYNAQSFGFKVNPAPPPSSDTLFNETNALKQPIPSDAATITPDELKTQVNSGEVVISSAASIEAAQQLREEQFQKDKSFIKSISNMGPYFKALADQAANQNTYEGDRAVDTPAGQQILMGLGTQLRNAVQVYALSQSPGNALADYTQTYNLLPDNLKTGAATPESLQGKSLADIQAALHTLDTLLSNLPMLDGTRPETQSVSVKSLMPRDAIKPGTGVDNNGVCASTKLQNQYWFPLKNFVSPIKNQANRGTCWAFAAIGAVESRERVQNDNPTDLSEQFLVNKVKQDWDSDDNNDGYWSNKALNAANDRQQTLINEIDWTYNPAWSRPYPSYTSTCSDYTGTCSESSHESRKVCTDYLLFTVCGYAKVTASQPGIKASSTQQIWANGQTFDLNRYRFLLAQGYVLIANFPVYKGFKNDATNGFVTNYAQTQLDDKGKEVAGSYGNHAVQIVGFLANDTLSTVLTPSNVGGGGYFIIKNSWGCGAGDGGYYYIPADYVSTNFIDLSILQFDTRRSNHWIQEQATPDGSIAPVITVKNPLNVVGLRIATDLATMFDVSHKTADSVNLTVTSSLGEKIYNGSWDTSKQPSLLPKNTLNYTFTTVGLRNITLVAKYGTKTTQSNFNIRVDNTAPTLTLQYSGDPIVNEAYPIIAQISDINEADPTKLCANTTWAVDGADVLSTTTGCQVKVTFATTGSRDVRVSTHDSEGLVTSKTLTLNVQPPPANPFPKITSQSVKSREYTKALSRFFCSQIEVANAATIDLTQLGCKLLLTGNDVNRYFASITVENPSNEALTYDWNLLVTYSGAEHILYTEAASSSTTFDLHDYKNSGLGTNPCRITVKVNAPDPARSKGPITVWTGQCTYHTYYLG